MPEANKFIEKRVYPRVAVNIPVKYRIVEDPTNIKTVLERKYGEENSHTMNVSLGGLYVVADHVLDQDSILRMEITLPEISNMITVYAEVEWSNDTGWGLHFEAIREDDLDALKNYLSQRTHRV